MKRQLLGVGLGLLVSLFATIGTVFYLTDLFFIRASRPQINPGKCLRCNIILVSIDSLRRDRMSLYGHSRITSPHIDKWSKRGIVFENYFSSSYLTPVSESSVHTGLYPETNGIISFNHRFADNIQPLAQILKNKDYRTAAIGNSPEFSKYQSLYASFSQGFDLFDLPASRLANGRSLDWDKIEKFVADGKKPFFLWLPIGDVHAPFGDLAANKFADPNYRGIFANVKFFGNMQLYYDGWFYNPLNPAHNTYVLHQGGEKKSMHRVTSKNLEKLKWPLRATSEDMNYIRDLYDNGVVKADTQFSRLLEILDKTQTANQTMIVLQSEHGESLGEHGYIAHYDIHDETVRVPLVITSPAIYQYGRTEIMASGVDILPTLLEHVGVPYDDLGYFLEGINLLRDDGTPSDGREHVFLVRTPLWESMIRTDDDNKIFDHFSTLNQQINFKDHAIRTRTHKLIHRTARHAEERFSCWTFISGKKINRPEFEFYDLIKDPGENQPQESDNPIGRDLNIKLQNWKKQLAR